MAHQTFEQNHEGFWIEKTSLPKESGIYFVYECTKNDNSVSIHKLIYIGESENINNRVTNHEKLNDWSKHVKKGNVLCYSFTLVNNNNRERVEAAFIYFHKPPENTEYINRFPYHKTSINSSGSTAGLIKESFTVG